MFTRIAGSIATHYAPLRRHSEDGQTLIEYALILFLVSISVIGVLLVLSDKLNAYYQLVSDAL